jgi:alkaline phosphatase D
VTLSRRAFLADAAIVGGVVLLDGPAAVARTRHRRKQKYPLARAGGFSLGVMSGFPGTADAVLWTRLDDQEHNVGVMVEVATDAGFRHVVDRSRVAAPNYRDHTVRYHAGRGLAPGQEYFYRFHTKSTSSPVGRLRTLRPPDSRQPLRLGVFSCQSYEAGYYTAHAGLAAEPDLDMVICLGDYVYEHHYYNGPSGRVDKTGANHDGDVQTLAEYRDKYRFYKADPDLQAMHAAHPFVPIWDDHEVEDNYAGATPDSVSKDPARLENDNAYPRRIPFAERRRNGYASFFEYQPFLRTRPAGTKIYRTVPLGANGTLFLTDERQYRSPQPCHDQLLLPCGEDNAPTATMLGSDQKAWFKNALAADGATWKLWANELVLMSLDSAPGVAFNPDQWDGYAAERAEILGFVHDRGIGNLVALTGDIHTYLAGNVTTTGRFGGKGVGTEFVGGSITSQGLEALAPLSSVLRATNPQLQYVNFTRRGYMVVEAGPRELKVDYRSPRSVMVPKSPVETLASFVVESGKPAVQVA